jgi:hypothetical protein
MLKFSLEKVMIVVLLALMLGSGVAIASQAFDSFKSPSSSRQWLQKALDIGKVFVTSLSTKTSPSDQAFSLPPSPSPLIQAIVSKNPLPSPQPTKKPTNPPRPTNAQSTSAACARFTVTHLDGSTSSLCYTSENRAKLQRLEYERSSAQAFYEFDMRSSDRYQQEYERSGSSIYLDAKQRSEQSAREHASKRDAAVAAMQEIEKQGW